MRSTWRSLLVGANARGKSGWQTRGAGFGSLVPWSGCGFLVINRRAENLKICAIMTKAGSRLRQVPRGVPWLQFSTKAGSPPNRRKAGPPASACSLLTEERVSGTRILLDRLTLAPGGEARLVVPAQGLAWFQMLQGEAVLAHDGERLALTDAHVAFLPPSYAATISSRRGAVLLYGEIPDAASLDPALAKNPPGFRVVDWTREPVLDSEHDARKRIYLVTPKLFGTKAVKGEMIIYPPGTAAANHHHVGAEHFMVVLRGRGTVYANEKPFTVRKGDVIYYPDLERHYLEAAPD